MQQIRQQPQVQSIQPKSPPLGQLPWPPTKVGETGQAVGKTPQGKGLASKNVQQQAKQNLQGQQQMNPQTQGPGWRPASGAEGGAQQLAPRP